MAERVSSQDIQDEQDSNGMSPGADSDSTGANNAPRPGSIKDRACPFCHQYFTSSSLGRHLDTFIRPKNPKAPDGVHDVAEIRKMRGNITRRHVRVSSTPNKHPKQASTDAQRQTPSTNGYTSFYPTSHRSTGHDGPSSVFRSKADWMVTGVINDLPPRNSVSSITREPVYRRTENLDPKDVEEREIAYATQMALKEALASIQEAASRAQKTSLFDFEMLSLNFPAICLHLLSPPTTLFSTTPTATHNSWPLEVPSESSYNNVHQILLDRIQQQVRQTQRKSSDTTMSPSNNTSQEPDAENTSPPKEFKPYLEHLYSTWQHWSNLSANRKHEVWTLELMRALADEKRKTQAMDLRLDDAHREVKYLRGEVDSLLYHSSLPRSKSPQSGQSNSSHAPAPALLPRHVANEFSEMGMDPREWDFDRLVTKWRQLLRPRAIASPYHQLGSNSVADSNLNDSSLQSLADASSRMAPAPTGLNAEGSNESEAADEGVVDAPGRDGKEGDSNDVEMGDEDVDEDDQYQDLQQVARGPKTRRAFTRQGAG